MCGDQVVMWRTGTAPHIGSRSTIGLWRWWKCTLIGKFESTLPTISVRWTWRQGRRWSLNTANACSWAVAWIPRRMWKWRCRSLKEDGENRGITTGWTSPLVVPTINKKTCLLLATRRSERDKLYSAANVTNTPLWVGVRPLPIIQLQRWTPTEVTQSCPVGK